jgi:hypothetical protein
MPSTAQAPMENTWFSNRPDILEWIGLRSWEQGFIMGRINGWSWVNEGFPGRLAQLLAFDAFDAVKFK